MLEWLFYGASFLIVITVLVFVHELGHYLVARWNGVKIEFFSIGLGPEVLGWTDRSGTRLRISLLPIGGYVKMFGDSSEDNGSQLQTIKDQDHSFLSKTVWQRIAIVVAGPLSNYLFAFVLISILFATIGQRYTPPVIDEVLPGSAAYIAGIQAGDVVKSINGHTIERFEDITQVVQGKAMVTLNFEIERNESRYMVAITPQLSSIEDSFGGVHPIGLLGVKSYTISFRRLSLIMAPIKALSEIYNISIQSIQFIGQMIIGTRSAEGLSGPLKIAKISGDMAKKGWVSLVWLTALLSISLGFFNLFPIPLLDGGYLIFYLIEVITGSPVEAKFQEWAFRSGFCIMVGFFLFTTWNDLSQMRFFSWLASFF